jgi:hypothetical protein
MGVKLKADVSAALRYKLKFSLLLTTHHAMKMYWGSEGNSVPRILDLNTRWRVGGQLHPP